MCRCASARTLESFFRKRKERSRDARYYVSQQAHRIARPVGPRFPLPGGQSQSGGGCSTTEEEASVRDLRTKGPQEQRSLVLSGCQEQETAQAHTCQPVQTAERAGRCYPTHTQGAKARFARRRLRNRRERLPAPWPRRRGAQCHETARFRKARWLSTLTRAGFGRGHGSRPDPRTAVEAGD